VIAEELQLGFEDLLDGPPGDGLSHIDSQGLDRIEVDVKPRAFFSVGTPGDNFTPAVRHVAKVGQILGLSLGEWHGVFVLELAERDKLEKSP
jgi:hypothetical protein